MRPVCWSAWRSCAATKSSWSSPPEARSCVLKSNSSAQVQPLDQGRQGHVLRGRHRRHRRRRHQPRIRPAGVAIGEDNAGSIGCRGGRRSLMATDVDRGVLTLREYRYSGEKYGCCLRLAMPCSPRHADIHSVAHILSHEFTLSVPELEQSFGRPHGGWSKFLRDNAAMLAFADVQVIEWGAGKGARVAAIRMPKNPQWFHFAKVWIKRISARKSLKMPTFDAGRWWGCNQAMSLTLCPRARSTSPKLA